MYISILNIFLWNNVIINNSNIQKSRSFKKYVYNSIASSTNIQIIITHKNIINDFFVVKSLPLLLWIKIIFKLLFDDNLESNKLFSFSEVFFSYLRKKKDIIIVPKYLKVLWIKICAENNFWVSLLNILISFKESK